MRILLVGATGRLGSAVHRTLTERGHEMVAAGRSSGDVRVDVTDPASVAAVYDAVGTVDAVACAVGLTPYKSLSELAPSDFTSAFVGKVASQVELVRQGLGHVSSTGSFTLISGILARAPIPTGTAASMANGAVEAFVRAAAVEIAPRRVNAVSPTVFTEALDDFGDFFPGFGSVGLADVAQAYVRSIEGAQTGQVFELD